MTHTEGPCSGCMDKLAMADSYLANWFYSVKEAFPSTHVCWSFRNQAEQDHDYEKGLSQKKWPESKHNFTFNGQPHSLALDLFELKNGSALFRPDFYTHIYAWSMNNGFDRISWGGRFKTLHDWDHFQIDAPTGDTDAH